MATSAASVPARVIALLGFACSPWALHGAGAQVVLWGTLLLAGLPIYVWMAHGAVE